MRLVRNVFRLCIVSLVGAVCLLPVGMARGTAVSIDMQDSVISIEAHEAALAVILHALAEKTGLSLDLRKPLTENISFDLKNVTLEEAIRRLMASHNYALTYRRTSDGRFQPDKLFVFEASASQRSSSQASADNVRTPPKQARPDDHFKMAWFREQITDADKLSGQLSATSFYDRSGAVNVLINAISDESPLRVIGLRPGDVIQNVNGKAVRSVQEFLQHLVSLPDNTSFVRIQRGSNAHPLYLRFE